jgi:hypothetical protein
MKAERPLYNTRIFNVNECLCSKTRRLVMCHSVHQHTNLFNRCTFRYISRNIILLIRGNRIQYTYLVLKEPTHTTCILIHYIKLVLTKIDVWVSITTNLPPLPVSSTTLCYSISLLDYKTICPSSSYKASGPLIPIYCFHSSLISIPIRGIRSLASHHVIPHFLFLINYFRNDFCHWWKIYEWTEWRHILDW